MSSAIPPTHQIRQEMLEIDAPYTDPSPTRLKTNAVEFLLPPPDQFACSATVAVTATLAAATMKQGPPELR
eukprot:CAMPEP_0174913254 /NCGR_PEP_ID=MMETSP0167-20121228/80224_1 /TAXON_ID=38298 /ORGANISM="Rhodella maculata, Strain CCMP736" /LENGTH=70 /DNA_ID=CAMNT_0016157967 /DNA_START=328 /DNA_END=540 /DNA_ORIENTATION=+